MKKTVLTFGLLAGGILSAMMLATMPFLDSIGYDKGEVIGYTTMVLAFLLIYFGVRSYRDNVAQGTVTFGRALAVGSLIALVASACYVATWEVIYFKLSPDFAAKFQAMVLEKAKNDGATPAEVEKRVAEYQKFAEMYKNPLINVAITFIEPLPVALVFAFVSAGILSRRRRSEVAIAT
jgi:hypothetical protein